MCREPLLILETWGSVLGRQETPSSEVWESALANLSQTATAKSEV